MIVIVPYQERWPAEFRAIGGRVRAALGDEALRIDHIGSTSVPGLAAKDVIDLQVTVAALTPALDTALDAAFGPLDYLRSPHQRDHLPPGANDNPDEWRKRLFKTPPGQRPANAHVRVAGRANQRYALLFRDYLRANPAAAESYAGIKHSLARVDSGDMDFYYEVKDPVCDLIMQAAEQWATAVGWEPDERYG